MRWSRAMRRRHLMKSGTSATSLAAGAGTSWRARCVDVPVAASTWVEHALICLVWTCLCQPLHGWNVL
eukprot:61083-Chlamydomonas_euryale.AAC.1